MSAIDSLGSTSNPPSATSGFEGITSGDFLEIMFTELQAQDPLEPQTTQALIDQLGSLREIEANVKLTQDLNRLVAQNEFAAASNLIGSLVSGISLDNRRVADLVISVSNTKDGPILNLLDGSRVMMSNVDEVVGPIDSPDDPDDPDNQDDGDESKPIGNALDSSNANPTLGDGNNSQLDAKPRSIGSLIR